MIPCGLNASEVGGGVEQIMVGPASMPDCQPLSTVIQQYPDGSTACVSRWQPSDEERCAIASGGDVLVWVYQVPPPPIAVGCIVGEAP